MDVISQIDADQPVLIAGPTASGKSALALNIAEIQGGRIINADALQVFDNWQVLTARPSASDLSRAVHCLYGHVSGDEAYSVGHWLRDLEPLLSSGPRPVIVGGTGLYFSALTEGLADIPPTPDHVRSESTARLQDKGLNSLLVDLDAQTRSRIDIQNPMRVQRAWEVQEATGRPLSDWQDRTPPALLPQQQAVCLLIDADKDWLNPRIERRFDIMLAEGALDEARANLRNWSPDTPSAKAIGAAELIAHLQGEMALAEARDAAIIATRQYAKRQRTWFRARMKSWRHLNAATL